MSKVRDEQNKKMCVMFVFFICVKYIIWLICGIYVCLRRLIKEQLDREFKKSFFLFLY